MRATIVSICLLMITALSFTAALGAVDMPDTRAGEIAAAYLVSFNSADEAQIEAFETKYRCAAALTKRSVADRVPRVIGLTAQLGQLEAAEIKVSSEHALEVVAQSVGTGMWLLMKFELEATEPFKLNSVMMMPGSAPAGAADAAVWSSLTELAAIALENSEMPGVAIAVADDQQVLDLGVAGVRAVNGAPIGVDDVFHIGSVTKPITATMVARLIELKLIAWDDQIGVVLADEQMLAAYAEVTLQELLTHRGGISAYTNFSDEEEARLAKLSGPPTAQRTAFCREVLQAEPTGPRGEFEYSNAGYALAALMAETKTGQSWEDLVRKHVFEPAGLKRSGYGWPTEAGYGIQPVGHHLADGKLVPQPEDALPLGDYLAPAGDIHMSVKDLVVFGQMHLRGLHNRDTIVSAATCQLLHTPAPGDIPYAAGWFVDQEYSWHAGSAGTFYALLRVYPALNRVVAVMTNVGVKGGDTPTRWIADAIIEQVAR